jgi:hypothetical protein
MLFPMSNAARKLDPPPSPTPERRKLLDRARAALVEVQIDATAAGLERLTPEEIAAEATAARVLASMRPIDRDFLLGRASFQQVAADLPEGVPSDLADAYVSELRELVELGMSMDEAGRATSEVAFHGSPEDVARWLENEERACVASK